MLKFLGLDDADIGAEPLEFLGASYKTVVAAIAAGGYGASNQLAERVEQFALLDRAAQFNKKREAGGKVGAADPFRNVGNLLQFLDR